MTKLIENKPGIKLNIDEYKGLNPRVFNSIEKLSKKLSGQVVIHINATPEGGGVVEILKSQIPFERTLGLKSYWLAINAPQRFFYITKKIHNLLQGKEGSLTPEEKKLYISISKKLSASLQDFLKQFESGIIIIHDPQPMAIIQNIPRNFYPILRFHIDLSSPNKKTLNFLKQFINEFSLIILSNPDYKKSIKSVIKNKATKIKIITPTINPLTEKNKLMDIQSAQTILQEFNINCSEPILTQVSRFDRWKDPMGVIYAYYLAKNKIPKLQLVLAGLMTAKDDPEAKIIFQQVKRHAEGDPDIFLFSNPNELGSISNDTFISALYTASTVIIQKSIKEGFGLTMTEAMWKGKAIIAGKTSGAKMQIKNGKNGIIISSNKQAARAIVKLIKDKKLREKLGKAAHKSVKNKFILPFSILEHLKIYLCNC